MFEDKGALWGVGYLTREPEPKRAKVYLWATKPMKSNAGGCGGEHARVRVAQNPKPLTKP